MRTLIDTNGTVSKRGSLFLYATGRKHGHRGKKTLPKENKAEEMNMDSYRSYLADSEK